MTETPGRRIPADDSKDLEIAVVALDRLLADRGKRDAVLHMLGDDGIHQYLAIVGQTAKP